VWTAGAIGNEVSKLDFGRDQGDALRNRVQSIPSPWARMTLFRNGLEEDGHPARRMVESELLDAFEFLWELNAIAGAPPEFKSIRLIDLQVAAEGAGSERMEDFASALTSLIPGGTDRSQGDAQTLTGVTVMVMDGRPILASSPFTGLFTAEDAAGPRIGKYFRYLHGDAIRSLRDRPFEFQKYVAEVLIPQLDESSAPDGTTTIAWASVRRLLKPWLLSEVEKCNAKLRAGQSPLARGGRWRERADELRLSAVGAGLGGLKLYKRDAGAAAESSRWLLASGRGGVRAPLIIDPSLFDGDLFHGAATITLPADLSTLDRDTLPGLGTRYPWVTPAMDWFTDRLFFLHEPIQHETTYGYGRLINEYRGDNAALRNAQFVLPLQPEILRYFEPAALDKMLQITVYDSGQVEVRLTLQLGADGVRRPVEVRKRYETAQHFRAPGPAVAIYPTFIDPRWKDYVVFTRADNAAVAAMVKTSTYRAGEPTSMARVKRTSAIELLSLSEAPEAISFDTEASGTGVHTSGLGILLPKYQNVRGATQEQWNIGVDFGTSNTVVCIRPEGPGPARPLTFDDGLLELTHTNDASRRAMAAFFFPETFKSGPFGTAVVHHSYLQDYNLATEHVGLRVNVPFTGLVDSDEQNSVVGDLKWSTNQRTDFLAGSFLRTVLSVVLAEGLKNGIDPSRIRIRWAYPRAFTPAQISNLKSFWQAVIESFRAGGMDVQQPEPPLDESAAVLSHFVNDLKIAPAGEASVLIDVGGGTSDIAIYERGQALALDSIMFGGKNLTGQRIQGNTAQTKENPFVRSFSSWCRANGLDTNTSEGSALDKYLKDGQDHLAFSYALSTSAFGSQGRRFVSEPSFAGFQGQILYFYSALFYYVGLTIRDLRDKKRISLTELPGTVIVAGNGSKYLDWLTEMKPSSDSAFLPFLARMLAAGARATDQKLPRISVSDVQKLEVGLGLVAEVPPSDLDLSGAIGESLVGENLQFRFDQAGTRDLSSTDRLRPEWTFAAAEVRSLRFNENESEIAAFHTVFLNGLPSLVSYGPQWAGIGASFRATLGSLELGTLHAYVSGRLQYLAQSQGGFRGSMLMLEATAVLELTANSLFAVTHAGATLGRST
jgi:hypothetical protein